MSTVTPGGHPRTTAAVATWRIDEAAARRAAVAYGRASVAHPECRFCPEPDLLTPLSEPA